MPLASVRILLSFQVSALNRRDESLDEEIILLAEEAEVVFWSV